MGEVVLFARDCEDGFLVLPYGWQTGGVVKGKWEGQYASLRQLKSGTIFQTGTCVNGLLHGEGWETFIFPDEDGMGKTTLVQAGNYIEGKKEGAFNRYEYGKKYSTAWYENNKVVYVEKVDL